MHIAKLQHRLVLCSQRDKVADGSFTYERHKVAKMWAAVEAKAASGFSTNGASMNESRAKRTHVIYARYRHDLNISLMAWLYEERLKSSPRWFKILKVNQTEQAGNAFFKFDCRLVERGDDLAEPKSDEAKPAMPGAAWGLPEGFTL